MTVNEIAQKIQIILQRHCTTAETVILSSNDPALQGLHLEQGHYLGITAKDAVEVDKIQAIMTMADAKIVQWTNNNPERYDVMIYHIPFKG